MALTLSLSLSGCDPREWFVCSIGACGPQYDEVPPDHPAQLKATPGDHQIALSWALTRPPDFSRYTIYRATTLSGPYTAYGASFSEGFTDTGLSNGTTYYYEVTALDSANNESRRSGVVSAVPAAPPPAALLAGPVLSATGAAGQIDLEWTEIAGAREYRVFRATTSGGPYAQVESTIVSFFHDRNVTAGTTYFYVVAAVDAADQVGRSSNEASTAPFSSSGPGLGLLATFGSFSTPRGIAADGAGNVYVTDNPDAGRVQKFTAAGTPNWGAGAVAHGIAVGPTGTVYVVDRLLNRVLMYTTAGSPTGQFGATGAGPGTFQAPTAIATDAAGSVYVVDTGNARIEKFTAVGGFVRQWAVTSTIAGIATDRAGDVYVVDKGNHRVQKFTGDGTPITQWGTRGTADGQFEAPEGIVVDVADRVFVADTGNDRIQIFTTAGVITQNFGASLDAPNALASDCNANLYILDAGNSRVKKLGPGTTASCVTQPARIASLARSRFTATMTTTASTPGKVSGNVTEKGARARGTFKGTTTARAFKAFAGGTWRARMDIAIDPRSRSGTAKGIALAIPKRKRAGRLCLGFDLKVSAAGKLSGTFKTLGGSGPARKLQAAGTFDETLGETATYTLRGNAAPTRRRSGRALPAACRKL